MKLPRLYIKYMWLPYRVARLVYVTSRAEGSGRLVSFCYVLLNLKYKWVSAKITFGSSSK